MAKSKNKKNKDTIVEAEVVEIKDDVKKQVKSNKCRVLILCQNIVPISKSKKTLSARIKEMLGQLNKK